MDNKYASLSSHQIMERMLELLTTLVDNRLVDSAV